MKFFYNYKVIKIIIFFLLFYILSNSYIFANDKWKETFKNAITIDFFICDKVEKSNTFVLKCLVRSEEKNGRKVWSYNKSRQIFDEVTSANVLHPCSLTLKADQYYKVIISPANHIELDKKVFNKNNENIHIIPNNCQNKSNCKSKSFTKKNFTNICLGERKVRKRSGYGVDTFNAFNEGYYKCFNSLCCKQRIFNEHDGYTIIKYCGGDSSLCEPTQQAGIKEYDSKEEIKETDSYEYTVDMSRYYISYSNLKALNFIIDKQTYDQCNVVCNYYGNCTIKTQNKIGVIILFEKNLSNPLFKLKITFINRWSNTLTPYNIDRGEFINAEIKKMIELLTEITSNYNHLKEDSLIYKYICDGNENLYDNFDNFFYNFEIKNEIKKYGNKFFMLNDKGNIFFLDDNNYLEYKNIKFIWKNINGSSTLAD